MILLVYPSASSNPSTPNGANSDSASGVYSNKPIISFQRTIHILKRHSL